MEINKIDLEFSSSIGGNEFSGIDRIIFIAKKLRGDTYVNSANGRSLYSSDIFDEYCLRLLFIDSYLPKYNQNNIREKNMFYILNPSIFYLNLLKAHVV